MLEAADITWERPSFLRDAVTRAGRGDPIVLTARELMRYWGARRRGDRVSARVDRDLAALGLRTEPDFRDGWIDSTVKVVLVPGRVADADEAPADVQGYSDAEIGLKVSALEVANTGVVGVQREQSLEMAQTLMMMRDYSQLAVFSGKGDVVGAINWESIAQARLQNPDAGLSDAVIKAVIVDHDEDLLPTIPLIVDAGFALVRGRDRSMTGIVTTADLSEQFAGLAGPFLLLGEIERRLRRALDVF